MHTVRNKKKLLDRVRRIKGQIEGLERLLKSGNNEEVALILQTAAASRGALSSLMCELIEGHVRDHILNDRETTLQEREQAVEDVVDIVQRYLR